MKILDTKLATDSIKIIDDRILELLSTTNIPQDAIAKATKYACMSGGKRLRPRMTLAVGGPLALDVAVAIEFIHTYSLIHDDLPCMDDDDLRRGKASLHRAYGESTALLTGDFLLTYAFEIIANTSLSPEIRSQVIQILTKAIGARGMIGGQVLDLATKAKPISWEEYQLIASKKTSALFIAALQCGAIIKGLDKSQRAILTNFGEVFGLIFQMVDDLDDKEPLIKTLLSESALKETLSLLTTNARHLLDLLANPIPLLYKSIEKYHLRCKAII